MDVALSGWTRASAYLLHYLGPKGIGTEDLLKWIGGQGATLTLLVGIHNLARPKGEETP